MSDYKRFLSYIYAYPGGIKGKNTGFAKVLLREGRCELNISLRGVYTDAPENFGVYIMVSGSRKKYKLVRVGELVIKSGEGIYNDVFNAQNIRNTEYSFNDIRGLAVAREDNRYYCMFSLWEDEEIVTGDTEFISVRNSYQESEKSNAEVQSQEAVLKNNAGPETEEKFMKQLQEPGIGNDTEPDREGRENREDREGRECKENRENREDREGRGNKEEKRRQPPEAGIGKDKDKEFELAYACEPVAELTSTMEELNNRCSADKDSGEADATDSGEETRLSRVEEMLKKGKEVCVFEDDYYYDCVEISVEMLKDTELSELVYDNSFLMHSYYNYKHLLLGRVKRNSKHTAYIIGVPGMYCNRERFMASMFGFNSFKKSDSRENANPYFGYWYQEI